MAICLIVQVFVSIEMNKQKKVLENQLVELFRFYFEHPYLELDSGIKKLLSPGEENIEKLLSTYRIYNKPPESSLALEEEQEHLNQIAVRVNRLVGKIPYRKWGLIPTNKKVLTLVTHMFIHGGWLHLIGNLLLLYLSGPFIEDAWGRPIYLVCYLVIGVFAAFMFSVHYPNFSGPLIGASGAISGMMGAFLIRFWRTRIKFIYFFIFPLFIRGSFKAPAWIMLPMWFILEMFNARMVDSIDPQSGGSVAHWAHVWGFALGVVVALGMKYFRIEERFISKKIETQTSYINPIYIKFQEAQSLLADGKKTAAFAILLNAVRSDPSHPEIGEMLMELGVEMGKTEEAAPIYTKVIENEIKMQRMESALRHYDRLRKVVLKIQMNIHSKIVLVEYLIKLDAKKEAVSLLNREIMTEIGPTAPPGLLLKLSAVALQLDRETAEHVIRLTCQNPEIRDGNKRDLLEKLNALTGKAGSILPNGDPEQPNLIITQNREDLPSNPTKINPEKTENRIIKSFPAVPLGVKDQKLNLEMERIGKKWLTLDAVKMISVVKITDTREPYFLLIDLFLDHPSSSTNPLRSIRFNSKSFDPKSIIPDTHNSMEAFRILVSYIQQKSQAESFPNQESTLLKKIAVFKSVEAYENSILTHLFKK